MPAAITERAPVELKLLSYINYQFTQKEQNKKLAVLFPLHLQFENKDVKKWNPASYHLCIGQTDHRRTSQSQFNASALSQKHPYITPAYGECSYSTHQQIFYFQSRTAFYLPGSKAKSMPAKHELHFCGEPFVSQDPWDQRKRRSFPFPSTPTIWVVERYVTGIESAPCNSHRRITVKYRNNCFWGFLSALNEVRKRCQDTNSHGAHSHRTAKFSLLSTQRQENLYVPKKAGLQSPQSSRLRVKAIPC